MGLYYIWNRLNRFGFLSLFSDKFIQETGYRIKFHRKCNLDNPTLFSEKIQWLMLYNRKPEYTQMVDKNLVKEYVASKIGERYVTSTIANYKKFSEIDLKELPEKFVLKCTHDSGGPIICVDKNKFSWRKVKLKYFFKLKRNYYRCFREWPYKNVEPQIIVEEYMENSSKEGLHDYKIWCFNGKAKYAQYITGRINNNIYEGFFDKNWNLLPFTYHNPIIKENVPKPQKIDKLFELASILSENLPFARIDFYILPDESIKFGEITFYPMIGLEFFHPKTMDAELGKLIDLEYGR